MDNEGASSLPILYACAGGSSVGQLANEVCREMTREGAGRLACLAGIGGHIAGMVDAAKNSSRVITVDGCAVKCAVKTLQAAGIEPTDQIVLTDLGIVKSANLYPAAAEIQEAKGKIREALGKKA